MTSKLKKKFTKHLFTSIAKVHNILRYYHSLRGCIGGMSLFPSPWNPPLTYINILYSNNSYIMSNDVYNSPLPMICPGLGQRITIFIIYVQ